MTVRFYREIALTVLLCLAALSTGRGENLLKDNADFETAGGGYGNGKYNFTGWEGQNYRWAGHGIKTDGPAGNGDKAFSMENSGYLETAQESSANIEGGYPYLLTFRCRKTVDDQPTLWIGLLPSIVFYDQNGAVVNTVWGQPQLTNGISSWQTIRVLGTAAPSAVKARVRVEFGSQWPHEDGRTFEVDDFTCEKYQDAETLGFRNAPLDIDPGQTSELTIAYRTPQPSDLLVRLVHRGPAYAEIRTAGIHGRGVATVEVPLPKNLGNADDYQWAARLVPPGGQWESGRKMATQPDVSVDEELKTDHSVKSDSPYLIFEGRWRKDANGHPRALWQGSSLLARFSGTSFTMVYTYNSWDGGHRLKVRVLVDGKDLTPTDPIALGQGSNQNALLATGLAPGNHTIRVIRDGEEDTTLWEVDGAELDPGAGLLRYRPFLDRKLEFYGDSTSSGGEGGMAVNWTKTTARALEAACSVVSKGATGVSGGFVFSYNALYYWDRFNFDVFFGFHHEVIPRNPYTAVPVPDPQQGRGEPWGPGNFDKYGDPNSCAEIADKGQFADWQPDGVVIGYGQNDQFGGGPFQSNYRQFVTMLRKVYPKANIFMTHTNMTANEAFLDSAMVPILEDRGPGGLNADGKVHMMLLHPSGNTNGGHPSIQNHHDLAYGNQDWLGTINWISDTLGWSGTVPDQALATETPGATPRPDTYFEPKKVGLNSPTPGATLYYTLDGTDPTPASAKYTGPIPISTSTTIKAFATSPQLPASNIAALTYKVQAASPVFDPPSGVYQQSTAVSISSPTTGATIKYTLDGTDPAEKGTVYTQPLSVTHFAIIKAIALKDGIESSSLVTSTYLVGHKAGLKGEYGNTGDDPNMAMWSAPELVRIDPVIDFSWSGPPGDKIHADHFVAQWTGSIMAPFAGSYTIYAASDDGIRVWLDDKLVIDKWVDRSEAEDAAPAMTLTAGQLVKVKIQYYQKANGASARLKWEGPGIPKQTIPETSLIAPE